MATKGVLLVASLGPTVSTATASSTSSVTHHVLSAQWIHQRPRTSEEAQLSGDASSVQGEGSQIVQKKNQGPLKTTKNFSDHSYHAQKITITWDPRHRASATKE